METRGATPPLGVAPFSRARAWCGDPGLHQCRPFTYLKLPLENPKYPIKNPRKVLMPPSSSTLDREGSEAVPGTLLERRIIAGGLYIAMPFSRLMSE